MPLQTLHDLRRVTADKDDRKVLKAAVDNPEAAGLRQGVAEVAWQAEVVLHLVDVHHDGQST